MQSRESLDFFVDSFNSQSQGLEHYKSRRLGTCGLVTRLRANRGAAILNVAM
ncbi:hypothetical protein K443DRAFT_679666 [Laccaria amethystina LaAM-08-1]|uniref:Uncharacterized protein n=1 Tax=Laccaria amethystina LaAM-08-1 TaxID=1095629 RepID=A0A0C9WPD6_9AGAR|nr:hypothetical protein K443DRAFT_679666 [Laccaria amethystina LaAM-08-1]